MTFLVCSEHGLVRTKKFETEEEAASYARVKALENHGIVYYVAEVKIEYSTKPVLIEGKTGVICYGEIIPSRNIEIGKKGRFTFKKGTYFVATRHNYFKHFNFPKGSTVNDVWRYLEFNKQDEINHIKVGSKN